MMNDCCLSKETRAYYNNFAYHICKSIIEKQMRKTKDSDVIQILDKMIWDLDDLFPSEDNGMNYRFERKLIELGFFYEEDKKKVEEIKKIYEEKVKEESEN